MAASLQGRGKIQLKSPRAGDAFETYIFHELKSYSDYTLNQPLPYWRSTSDFEVDFIFNEKIAIETKAKSGISAQALKGLKAFQEEKIAKHHLLVCLEPKLRKVENIEIVLESLLKVCDTRTEIFKRALL